MILSGNDLTTLKRSIATVMLIETSQITSLTVNSMEEAMLTVVANTVVPVTLFPLLQNSSDQLANALTSNLEDGVTSGTLATLVKVASALDFTSKLRSVSFFVIQAAAEEVPTAMPTVRGEAPLDLGAAERFAIFAGSTVTSTGTVGTIVTGDVGIYPGTALGGFPPAVLSGTLDAASASALLAKSAVTAAYLVLSGKSPTASLS
eukprot:gene3017-3555_t